MTKPINDEVAMEFYAHTRAGCPEHDWEPLRQHLAEVAAGARQRGERFGAGALCEVAGLLHDAGKYSAEFQARLRGAVGRVDHSTAGAVWARETRTPLCGRLLAHVIAGHHAGLKDELFAVEGRIDRSAALLASVQLRARADGLDVPTQVSRPRGMDERETGRGFHLAFLARMIFSCLIEADRTAAAAFAGDDDGAPTVHPSIAELDAAFHAFLAPRVAATTPLNNMRASVFRTAVARAAEAPGVFTLTVPTGGGKTLTSLGFALAHARANGLERVVVVIPFTSVIEQTARVYREALGALSGAVLEHHSAFEMADEAGWGRDRAGPDRLRLAMERWDSPIVVTTAVQFFESLFSNRPSRCRKLHSLARSVVVVDEAQTMPLGLLRPCVVALKELARNYGTSVVLCTATQPALSAPEFAGGFANTRELAGDDVPALFAAMRRVTVRHIGVQDDAALADRMAASNQALCIVNQRAHARGLFRAIQDQPGAGHLSTCMHSVHRSRVLAEIRKDLAAGRPCRVVSTSLIEAGVDVDFPLVLRASAGLDQIAQAAGRCNREFKHGVAQSEVLVFEAAAYGVIQALKANAEAGAEMLGVHADDPLSPAAIEAFFNMLYWRKTHDELDKGRVLRMCNDHKGDLDFPFETIAREMRFIDDAMLPVIVACEEEQPGQVAALVRDLRFAKSVGGIARKLGRYTVGVPRAARSAMVSAKVAETIRAEEFGDQFVVLHNLDLYRPDVGLDWSAPTFRSVESLMSC
jgi:CRISPR-associated endonuclease/helicase Cas3